MTTQADEFLDYLYGPDVGGSEKRPWVFLKWARTLDPAQDGASFWYALATAPLAAWPDFDAIPHTEFAELINKFRADRPHVGGPFNTDDHQAVTVYRGQDACASIGISWTVDVSVAEGFARGHRQFLNRQPTVFTLQVSRPEVAFLCDEREESEVVLMQIPDRSSLARIECSV